MAVSIFLILNHALIAVSILRGDYMVELYTLPTCPICEMIKKKMQDKGIEYKEIPFEQGGFDTDRAPIMRIYNDRAPAGTPDILHLESPSDMVSWISEWRA